MFSYNYFVSTEYGRFLVSVMYVMVIWYVMIIIVAVQSICAKKFIKSISSQKVSLQSEGQDGKLSFSEYLNECLVNLENLTH